MANQGELIAQFIEISGSDENVAQFYLSSSDWSLEVGVIRLYAFRMFSIHNFLFLKWHITKGCFIKLSRYSGR